MTFNQQLARMARRRRGIDPKSRCTVHILRFFHWRAKRVARCATRWQINKRVRDGSLPTKRRLVNVDSALFRPRESFINPRAPERNRERERERERERWGEERVTHFVNRGLVFSFGLRVCSRDDKRLLSPGRPLCTSARSAGRVNGTFARTTRPSRDDERAYTVNRCLL